MTRKTDHLSEDQWLQLVRHAVSMPDAPADWLQSALGLWQPGGAPASAEPRRWVAVLSFDSWAASPAAAGMRALPSEMRQMLFSARDLDVDLRIAPLGGRFAISGQLLGRDVDGGRVELERLAGSGDAPAHRVASLTSPGEFSIDGVAAGTYLITIGLTGDEIVLAPIQVGPPQTTGGL